MTNCGCLASFEDPMKKREQFAVSLRKQKTNEIINNKRRRTNTLNSGAQDSEDATFYRGHPDFEDNKSSLDEIL
jgi:Importin beta binding domain